MSAPKKKFRFWAILPDGGGVGGILTKKPKMRKQDRRFQSGEYYAVVFFPRITGLWRANFVFAQGVDTLSRSPEVAKAKFMDGIAKDQKWETYAKAGHRVRKVKIIDMGDAQ